jgi:hypothetical protein
MDMALLFSLAGWATFVAPLALVQLKKNRRQHHSDILGKGKASNGEILDGRCAIPRELRR